MAMVAIIGTAGPGSGPRRLFRCALRKRCGLTIASTLRLFELSLEKGDAFLQFRDAAVTLNATRAERSGHIVSVAESAPAAAPVSIRVQNRSTQGATWPFGG
jgi:hypothetical protein